MPCAPILSRDELLTDPQIAANGLIVESTHPLAGAMRQPRPAARFAETPSALRSFAPILGEHTDGLLAEIGLSRREIEELHATKVVA